ncbi:MAG: ASKHA domain-containing protein [Treponema sp.]|nr:ASKHA domain-containing protein [Treponema sp.]
MPRITFLPANITIESQAGSSLLEAARRIGVFIETPCGGKGTCQKCNVQITGSGERGEDKKRQVLICQFIVPDYDIIVELPIDDSHLFKPRGDSHPDKYLPEKHTPFIKKINLQVTEPALLDGLSDADRFVRAFQKEVECQSVDLPLNVLKDLPEKLREKDGKIIVYYYRDNNIARIIDIPSPKSPTNQRFDHSPQAYALAIDIGTTTAALLLVDIETGKVLSSHNAYNSQVECALDVIGRINYAKKNLAELRDRILKTINELTAEACKNVKINQSEILCVSIAGNTTMIHLLLGVMPEYIRLSPYTPAVFCPQMYTAFQVGINANENAPLLFAPAVGSYVGGDITAGLLCTDLARKTSIDEANNNDLILFIDIGTNGEIVLGNNDFVFACACSAGPAFEGGGIKCGMRASNGAIERVVINEDGKPQVFTIGDAAPAGICGSGVISVVAKLFRKGIIDSAGKFAERKGEYVLCEADSRTGKDKIAINETDIDNFIRAKGAIFSACQTMLESVGMSFNDVKTIYVAGGFGNYLNLEDAGTIGLLPRLDDEKYIFLGNSSVVGAYLSLVCEERRAKMFELASQITYMDLSSEPRYMDHYTGALFLPHTNKSLFE